MKYITTINISIVFSISCSAQINATYDTCSRLTPYAGNWLYAKGADTIRIFLKVHRGEYTNPIYVFDALWGYLEYKHGNSVVVSDYYNRDFVLPSIIENLALTNKTITLRFFDCSGSNLLIGRLRYRLNGDQLYKISTLMNSAGTQMIWHQEFIGTDRMDYSIPWNRPTGTEAMPNDFLLIKQ